MKQFETGKIYGAYDTAVPPIKIIKRTPKMIQVKDTDTGEMYRMKIHMWNGYELLINSAVPDAWKDCYTYSSQFEIH